MIKVDIWVLTKDYDSSAKNGSFCINIHSLTSAENDRSALSKSLKISSQDSPQSELKFLTDENVNADKLFCICPLSDERFAQEGVSGVSKRPSSSASLMIFSNEPPKSKAFCDLRFK